MRKTRIRRTISLLMALAICTTLFSVSASATTKNFTDVPTSHWAYSEIAAAVEDGIAAGYEDGTFKPGNSVTKAQFAVMLSRAFFPDDIKKNQANADGQAWYWANLKTLADRGLLYGTVLADESNWASRGGVSITRYEMAQLMSSILGAFGKTAASAQKSAAQNAISDWRFISPDYQDAVATCYALGMLNGQSDGSFGGANPMNRAQGCVVIGRLKDYIAENSIGNTAPVDPATPTTPTEPENPGQVVKEPTPTQPTQATGTGKLANGKDITVDNVLERLDEIREEYPEGTVYMPVGQWYSTTVYSGVSRAAGCAGWAAMVSDMIFGAGTANRPRVLTDHSKIRPGDIIDIYENGANHSYHTFVATSNLQPCSPYNCIPGGMSITTTESNSSHTVGWNDSTMHLGTSCEIAANENDCYWVVYTRYPD